jgi:MFS family permease
MLNSIKNKIKNLFYKNKLLSVIYTSNILLSLHYYLIIYINSSFLGKFWNESQVSTLYVIGSTLSLIILLNISKILNKIGNLKLISIFIGFEIFATLGMSFGNTPVPIALYFIIHHISIPAILISLDIFLESLGEDESHTGEIRGVYLTLSNIMLVISPILISVLIKDSDYQLIYIYSLFFIIPIYLIMKRYFRKWKIPPAEHFKLRETMAVYFQNKNLYDIFVCNFLLQTFYAFMVIYSPIYLSKFIGFSWSQIGVMFTIMLLPFVLFELPIGELADKKYGEKEIMTIGFLIMGLATIFVSFITIKDFLFWTIILFLTRTGASLVEITADSYFFKQVRSNQSNIISFYRMARSLSFIVAPILATVIFEFMQFKYIFLILGISVLIIGSHYSLALKDTK